MTFSFSFSKGNISVFTAVETPWSAKGVICILLLFFLCYLPSPKVGLTPSGTCKQNARGPDACRGSNRLWTRTLDRYTSSGLPECVVRIMSGPPRETIQDRTQTKDTHPVLRIEIKISGPAGNRTRAAGLEDRDSTAHARLQ